MELDIAYFLRAYPTFFCAACNQHCHTTSCSLNASCCFVSSVEQEGQAMTEKEREIFYKLLIDLLVETPHSTQINKSKKREVTHEKVSPISSRRRQSQRSPNTAH